MKNLMFLPVILMVFTMPIFLPAQQQVDLKSDFSTLAVFKDSKKKVRGYLVELQDSVLVFSDTRKFHAPWEAEEVSKFQVTRVETLKVRNEKTKLLSAGIGIAAGMIAGGFIGKAMSPEAEDGTIDQLLKPAVDLSVIAAGGLIGSLVGGTVGFLIGSRPKIYSIDGQQARYQAIRGQLEDYTMEIRE